MRWLSAIVIIIAVIGSLAWIKYSQVMAAIAFGESFPEPSETVNVVTVSQELWSPVFTLLGEVKSPKEAMLRNELEGVIEQINITPGDRVEKGRLLLQLNVEEEQAQLQAAKARIELAQLDVNRLSKLSTSNAASQDQLDRAKAQLKVSEAEAAALVAAINKKSVYAPFAGVVGLHDLDAGEYLAANSDVVRLVAGQESLWVDFSLPQIRGSIDVGEVIAVTDADDNRRYPATVIAVEPQLTLQSRSLPVRALIDQQASFSPGEMVKVEVTAKTELQVARLPIAALRHDSFGAFVYTLSKDDADQWRAQRRPVDVAFSDAQVVLVEAGLEVGETVATTGAYKLSAGKLTFVKPAGDN